jgi:hypothetical protein
MLIATKPRNAGADNIRSGVKERPPHANKVAEVGADQADVYRR